MIIQHNMGGLNSIRNQKISSGNLKKNLEKLSSGYRINRAGDDAAGLAISELMRSQIRGLDQAQKNANDGIGMAQTMDGALTEVHSMLNRMKTLAVEAANGTYNSQARASIDLEREQLLEELDRIGGSTNFNSIPLFNDDVPKGQFTPPEISDAITLQIGHSQSETLDVNCYYMSTKGLALEDTDFKTLDSANESVDMINNAIQAVSDMRGHYGSIQNHLEHTHNELSVTEENMTSAESRIRDTNMAEEYVSYTKENLVRQTAQAMLAQANSVPQSVLSLLQ